MIANLKEMQIAFRSLRILEEALTALREQLTDDNPDLLAAAAPAYLQRIALLQSEIAEYLYAHPSDVSQLAAVLPLERQTVGQ